MSDMQQKWDSRWLEKATAGKWQPDPWLQRIQPLLLRGHALDVACGMGRNAIFLAEQGFEVTAIDISQVALDLLEKEAQQRRLSIETMQVDLEAEAELPAGPFDMLLNFFYLHRPILPQELSRVRPGGIVIVRTFSCAGTEQFGEIRPEIALRPGELLEIFADWKVLLHEEGLDPSAKGGSLAGIVAQRPK